MFIRSALLSLSALAAAREMQKDAEKATKLYDSGIRHANNMALKMVCFSLAKSHNCNAEPGSRKRLQDRRLRVCMLQSSTVRLPMWLSV